VTVVQSNGVRIPRRSGGPSRFIDGAVRGHQRESALKKPSGSVCQPHALCSAQGFTAARSAAVRAIKQRLTYRPGHAQLGGDLRC
jgi:hypothetical protein